MSALASIHPSVASFVCNTCRQQKVHYTIYPYTFIQKFKLVQLSHPHIATTDEPTDRRCRSKRSRGSSETRRG